MDSLGRKSDQIIVFSILNNWVSFTGGPLGLPGIPQPEIFGLKISSHLSFLIFVVTFALLTYLFLDRLMNSPFGRILKAIREDEIFTTSLGKDVMKFKLTAFIIGASIVGSAILIVMPEILRFVGMPNSIAANMRQIFYGLLLVLFMMFRPQGILGEFAFGKEGEVKTEGEKDA